MTLAELAFAMVAAIWLISLNEKDGE